MKLIPYGHQWIDRNDRNSVLKVLESDWITQGPKIKEFEQDLCRYTGARYAVAVANGTAALHCACLAAGIKGGDEVITSPITFLASANCILYSGGRPVFADIESTTATVTAKEIEKCITSKTKAIIPVDFAGHPCKLEAISRLAKKHNLIVIDDAAHALGAECNGVKIGSGNYADMTIFSFHPVKAITTGEGGAVVTNSEDLYEKLLLLRNHGLTKTNLKGKSEGNWYYEMQMLGYNYRITDIQAALGVSQLKKLDMFIAKRREIAALYNKNFADNPYFDIPIEEKSVRSAYHLYAIKLKNSYNEKRAEIFSLLQKNGLGVQVHYIPVYWQPYYKRLGYKRGLCPIAEDFYEREISLPIFPELKQKQITYVIRKVLSVIEKATR